MNPLLFILPFALYALSEIKVRGYQQFFGSLYKFSILCLLTFGLTSCLILILSWE